MSQDNKQSVILPGFQSAPRMGEIFYFAANYHYCKYQSLAKMIIHFENDQVSPSIYENIYLNDNNDFLLEIQMLLADY